VAAVCHAQLALLAARATDSPAPSVYRELDVASRSEAVARGRTAGLIDRTIA
jgi:hypothetical protein